MKRALMIAYHYPPCCGSSGLQRTLCFSRDLPELGWSPIVLTAHPRAYEASRGDQLADIPKNVPVKRAFALDSARHLGWNGRYWARLALPDRWVSWLVGAVPVGLGLIHKYRPRVLWSTYPIATAHLIGLALHRLTGIPWVADFRDPMTEEDPVTGQQYPTDPGLRKARRIIEQRTVAHCARAVFVAWTALRIYADRYPELPNSRWAIIPNGYDGDSFEQAERMIPAQPAQRNRIVLLHSGVLYPTPDRDPSAFFAALAKLRRAGGVSSCNLKVVLRASGYEHYYRKVIAEQGLEDLVFLEPAIPYREALAEMLCADGLLVFQGYTSNPAIPAKLYEYLRARRPILAMADSEGDTAQTLRDVGIGRIVPLDSSEQIAAGLSEFLRGLCAGTEPVAGDGEIQRHSRRARAKELALLLDAVQGASAQERK